MDYIEQYKKYYGYSDKMCAVDRCIDGWRSNKATLSSVIGIAPEGLVELGMFQQDMRLLMSRNARVAAAAKNLLYFVDAMGIQDCYPEMEGLMQNRLPDGQRLTKVVASRVDHEAMVVTFAQRYLNTALRNVAYFRYGEDYDFVPWDFITLNDVERSFQTFFNMLGSRKKLTLSITTDPVEIIGASLNASFSTCTSPGGSFSASNFIWAAQPNTAMIVAHSSTKEQRKVARAFVHLSTRSKRIVVNRVYGDVMPSFIIDNVKELYKEAFKIPYQIVTSTPGKAVRLAAVREKADNLLSRAPYIDIPSAIIGKKGTNPKGARINVDVPTCIICGIRHTGSLCVCQGCK